MSKVRLFIPLLALLQLTISGSEEDKRSMAQKKEQQQEVTAESTVEVSSLEKQKKESYLARKF